MKPEKFQPTLEGEARLLLLIAAFSHGPKSLEGRTKLAKLDFLLRYPAYLQRALRIRKPKAKERVSVQEPADIDSKMVRYRYGPWDPTYYALIGRLVGKGLIKPVPFPRGVGYRTTPQGHEIAANLMAEPAWQDVAERAEILRRHFDLAGTSLKKFIYKHFPEVTSATWGESL